MISADCDFWGQGEQRRNLHEFPSRQKVAHSHSSHRAAVHPDKNPREQVALAGASPRTAPSQPCFGTSSSEGTTGLAFSTLGLLLAWLTGQGSRAPCAHPTRHPWAMSLGGTCVRTAVLRSVCPCAAVPRRVAPCCRAM